MKHVIIILSFLTVCASINAQTSKVEFNYPLSAGTKFIYKFHSKNGMIGENICKGLHTWIVKGSREIKGNMIYEIASVNRDTIYYERTFRGIIDTTINFTVTVTPDTIIDSFYYSVQDINISTFTPLMRIPRYTESDTLIKSLIGYPAGCRYISGKGMDYFAQNLFTPHSVSYYCLEQLAVIKDTSASSVPGGNGSRRHSFLLEQNYPNPFNPDTRINYSLTRQSRVNITVFDALGRSVALLVDENKPAGNYTIDFNAVHLPGGVYFCRMMAEDFTETRKMLLIK